MLNRIALSFAWLSLIGIVAAGIGYVYLSEPPAQHADATGDAGQQAAADPDQGASPASDSDSNSENASQSETAQDGSDEDEAAADNATQDDAGTHMADQASGGTPAGHSETAASGSAVANAPGQSQPSAAGNSKETNPDKLSSETAEAAANTQDSAQEADVAPKAPEAAATATAAETTPQEPAPQTPAEPAAASAASPENAKPELAKPENAKPETSQQAALPRVAAPDHNSLPLWKRNRQTIDRRWLKDSSGKPKPRIAFVLSELGHARIAAEEIIKVLPPAITLSFSPYANPRSLEYLSALARSNGHEVMLDLPLEPIDFPQRDPGPMALLTALEPKENLERLDWSLQQTTGYVGVAVWMGSRFVGSPRQMRPLFEAVSDRGLIFLDNAEREDSLAGDLAGEFDVPTIQSHRYVDVPLASRDAIDARLAQVERIALQFGSAVAMGRPFPVTVERLAEWAMEIEKRGIVLVPITVLAEEAIKKQRLAARPLPEKSQPKAADPE